jgi:DNA-binding NarL/FixJ family response regulator
VTSTDLRILIVDDHAVVRAGLRALVEGEPGLEVVAESGDGEEAVRLAGRLRPDIALMDLLATSSRPARPSNSSVRCAPRPPGAWAGPGGLGETCRRGIVAALFLTEAVRRGLLELG